MVAEPPLPPIVEKTIHDIKNIKIQGARNVAKEALKSIQEVVKEYDGNSADELLSMISLAAFRLMNSRPTEPMTRELLSKLLQRVVTLAQQPSVEKIKKALDGSIDEHLKKMEESFNALAEVGSNVIPNNAIIMTYCHSSTATALIKRAHEKGKVKEVFSCETRPLYQGHITANELAEAGVNVKTIVDGASSSFMEDVDIVIVGADAIQADGSLINKIGTRTLAIVAKEYNVPFYSAAELFKYDAQSIFGFQERIEQRPPEEVWNKPPKGVSVLNPAFDMTPAKYITSYITEAGLVTPQRLPQVFEDAYRV